MNTLRITTLAAFVAGAAVACSSTNLEQKPAPAAQARSAPAPERAPAPEPVSARLNQVGAPPPSPIDPLDDPSSILTHRSVYFDFDRSAIHDPDIAVLEAHGRYLVTHAARVLRIEGNCDERGGREYNLALGQRRAEVVRERLKVLGVSPDRAETVSLGKEKPRDQGHDEAAWAENRRADIIYR